MRRFVNIEAGDVRRFQRQILEFCSREGCGAILNSNGYYNGVSADVHYHGYDFLAAIGIVAEVQGGFEELLRFKALNKDWLFGFLSYDLKNELEQLGSGNPDGVQMPGAHFFCPRFVVICEAGQWRIGFLTDQDDETSVASFLTEIHSLEGAASEKSTITVEAKLSEAAYVAAVEKVLGHIHRGDVYELNYCMEFFANNVCVDPAALFDKLTELSPTPFSAFYALRDRFLISASPERFFKIDGRKIISQPIKGTIARGKNPQEDEAHRLFLSQDTKERSENVMITDLVRNDLSRIACRGSVEVEELCGVYPFKQVFQMVSTVSAQLKETVDWLDALRATFPMGSMTGAPKVKAMALIEHYEQTRRGLYSGAVGYVTPEGNCDFNVVIRSMLYNKTAQYLSFMVGSAITSLSNPTREYAECLLKGEAIMRVLSQC